MMYLTLSSTQLPAGTNLRGQETRHNSSVLALDVETIQPLLLWSVLGGTLHDLHPYASKYLLRRCLEA